MGFDYATLDQPLTHATLTDADAGGIRTMAIDHAAPPFDTANRLWAGMALPAAAAAVVAGGGGDAAAAAAAAAAQASA
jgi:hypothetical protein